MIEKPKFWGWAKLMVSPDNYMEVFRSRRVLIISAIEITLDFYDPDSDNYIHMRPSSLLAILKNLFTAVLDGRSHLKTLVVMYSEDWEIDQAFDECHEDVDLTPLNPELLSEALIRMEE